MKKLIIKHNELTAEEFILLWETVWGQGPSLEQTRLAMEHTLFRVSVFDDDHIVAMWNGGTTLFVPYYHLPTAKPESIQKHIQPDTMKRCYSFKSISEDIFRLLKNP